MVKNNLGEKYNRGTIVIHWLTAILILTLFPLGKYMEGLEPAEKLSLIQLHAILGMLVFLLTFIRTYIFFTYPKPEDLKTGSKLNDKLAVWIHNAFYFLLFAISISGIATMFQGGYIDALLQKKATLILVNEEIMPLKGHGITALIMMILLVLHVAGVIKHLILTKENTLKRIS